MLLPLQFCSVGRLLLAIHGLSFLLPVAGVANAACGDEPVTTQGAVAASDEPNISPEQQRFFEARIRPVLMDSCGRCHSTEGGQGIRGGLSVSSREALRVGGESGPAVVPGDLDASLLWEAINYRGLRMPPNQKLPPEVIADFRQWIEMGAPDPRVPTEQVVQSKVTPEKIAEGRSFWAFQVPRRPELPPATQWSSAPIDRLLARQYTVRNLQPAPDAEPLTLLRRLYLDLIGLPPSPDQQQRFAAAWLQDPQQAVETTADELLARPQYGERWGRHWLDVVRFAESTGKEVDVSAPNAWRYRDYVIDAFNEDKPYDRFVREQLAGDLLAAKTDEQWASQLIATGFLALGPKALIEQNPRQFQADLIDEQIDVTTRVFLGVSVACARCHDHKFDPIPQSDYYALAGIFQSTETCFGGVRSQRNRHPSNLLILPVDDPNPCDTPLSKDELAELRRRRDEVQQQAAEARRAAFRPQPGGTNPQANPANQFILDQQATQLTTRINSVDENGQPLTVCMGVQDRPQPQDARLLIRGEIDQQAQTVPRGFVQVLGGPVAAMPANGSGRLQLARWIADESNPLTARVMVNRIWLHLFGEAIVRETENFGASGPRPTDQQLLDYLAVQFMDNGWSVKTLIREIVSSRAYRLSSAWNRQRFEQDPDNLYFARAQPRRLQAEVLRDCMLAASGRLDLQRPRGSMVAQYPAAILGPNGPVGTVMAPAATRPGAGPGMSPAGGPETSTGGPLARRLQQLGGAAGRFRPGQVQGNPFDASVAYRSVYLPVARGLLPRALEVFDFAEPSMVIGQRESSNTPAQALYLLNNRFVIEQSEVLASRLQQESADRTSQIQLAFRLVYGRAATEQELAASQSFLLQAADVSVGLAEFCQALFATAEFRYVN
ncbi:MAG: PSD1 and planctomycete cytochrome C domain-containing protein [Planctomyces sp.]